MTERQQTILDDWFTYHAPFGDQADRYTRLREKARELAALFIHLSPECADQTVALRSLRLAVMEMNSTIACNEKEPTA